MAFQYLKGGCKKEGDRLFSRVCCDRTRGNGFRLKEGRLSLDIRKNFYNKDGEALEQFAHRVSGCLVPGDFQGQAGQGSEQPDCAIGSLQWSWTRCPLRSLPNQMIQ